MTRSRILVGVASVLAGTTVLFIVMGFVANPILLLAAIPFAAATYLLWSHATGRLDARMRERARIQDTGSPTGEDRFGSTSDRRPGGSRRTRKRQQSPPWEQQWESTTSRRATGSGGESVLEQSAAARVLGVDPDADDATVRRAFRRKAKELHPDAPEGDEAAFKRVRAAYETLRSGQ